MLLSLQKFDLCLTCDIHALLNTGLLDKSNDGKIVFPFDSIYVDFMLQAA